MLRRMSEAPWLTIVGLGEDGPNGLCAASQAAIDDADIVWGAKRHLALVPGDEWEDLVYAKFASGEKDISVREPLP